jgi:hypothetical protein
MPRTKPLWRYAGSPNSMRRRRVSNSSALPAYFGATDGVTADGTPTGNLAYAAACFVVAALAVAGVVSTNGAGQLSSDSRRHAVPAADGR